MTRQRPATRRHRPLHLPLLLLAGLTLTSGALMLLSGVLAQTSLDPLLAPLDWLAGLDVGAAFDVLSNAAEVVAAVLAIAITVVAIVVELAANRYSHEITRLFLREPVNVFVLGLYVVTTLQCVWTATVIGDAGPAPPVPHAGFGITLAMVVTCLLLLVPYMYFVFAFLSPINVIERIGRDAYREILRVAPASVARSQGRVEEAVDQLHDVARGAIAQGDRSIAMAAVNAMSELLVEYVGVRDRLPDAWFRITDSIAADPDFVALAPDTMAEVESQGLWLERKILRRYLSLMGQSAGQSGDTASLIGINTQQIASSLGAERPTLLELCRRAFNSYLRATINARDPRTAYFLMNQYRVLAERLLQQNRPQDAVRIADYLGEYGQLAYHAGLPFLLETVAYDVMQLIEVAVELESPALDALLDRFLDLDREARDDAEEGQLSVRRAQIQLATLLMHCGDEPRVARVVADLRSEKPERLERIRSGLLTDDRPQFWELLDRGANFRYLVPERRVHLEELFRRLQAA